jgi:Phospholipase_D-nuclease N-terminal
LPGAAFCFIRAVLILLSKAKYYRMELAAGNGALVESLIFTIVVVNYLLVVLTVLHIIFKSGYALTERLLWMVVIWILPVIGLSAYWFFWRRKESR